MAKSTKNGVSYQNLGNGTYRVVGAVRRSAVTGRYVLKSEGRRISHRQEPVG
jgi:hypothetical protein